MSASAHIEYPPPEGSEFQSKYEKNDRVFYFRNTTIVPCSITSSAFVTMQHQPPNGWLALLREKDVKQLLDVARKQLQDCTIKNYKKESFISMDDVKRATATEEIDALFTKYERQSPIDGLPIEGLQWKDSRMLFAVALLANLEDVYVRLLLEGLKDDLLFDDHEFTTLCQSADATVDRLKSIRNLFGAIVRPGKLQVFSKGVILPYPTRAKLDNGSYGQVYKVKIARDHLKGSDEVRWKLVPPAYITNQSQRVVAEKEIRPSDDGMGSKEEWDRLCRETSTLEKRQHPNIIPLLGSYFFEFEESEIEKKTLHLIFPLADQNLASWMACAPNLEAEQRTRIDIYRRIYRLVSSLSYLHRELPDGFTSHHDFKPSNILVFGSEFKFADFGASHLRSSISGSETARPHLGTYEYHPPEYWGDDGRKASSLHGRSFDAWPMGCVILELATLIVHGWSSSMVSKFRDERLHNSVKRRPMLLHERKSTDCSFHNNPQVVDRWVEGLKHDGSRRVKDLLRVAENLMAENPRSRLYLWEAELDLYTIFDVDADLSKRLERNALMVQHPPRKILNGTSTPLHRAAQASNSERAHDLLRHEWPLFVQDQDGNTAADLLDQNPHSIASDFLEQYDIYRGRGRVVRAESDRERSPFGLIRQGDKIGLELLLEKGIDCAAFDEHDHTLIHYALQRSCKSMLELLMKFVDRPQLRRRDAKTKLTPLQAAATKDYCSHVSLIIDYLIRRKHPQGSNDHTDTSDIEERTLDGKTALFLAIERGYIATTEMLLDLGAQIFTQCRQGNTPIHAVASAEDIPLDESLLARIFGEKEAVQCFEHKNQFGQTPIALALLHQNLECFRLLKEKSASIHTVNDKGENLLHIMATMGHYDDLMGYVDEFDQSAFEDKDIHGMTPSMIAEKCQNLRWLGLFESRRVKNSTGPESIPAVKDQPNFYTLNAGEPWLFEHKGSRYWEHLTYHSFAIYETIYHRCKRGRAEIQCMFTKESHSGSRNIASGNLTINIVTDFAAQFFNSWPNERTQRQAWERLLQPPYKPYPKPMVLAILYMLHLEQFSTKKQNTITDERFNILTRFDLWIGCRCSQTCGKQWNFVNRIGMYRPLDVQTSACKAVQALKNRLVPAEIPQRKSYNPFHRKQDNRNQDNGRVLEDMYEEWKLYK
ncbi:MAG: hypothetical protein Q9223_004413 [Gallowayella weberi]